MSLPYERVRATTRQVVEQARLVRLDTERLRQVVDTYDPILIRAAHTFTSDYHFLGSGELQLNYVFTLDALNFGSGLSPLWKNLEAARLVQGSLYKTVADNLRRAMLAGELLDPVWAASITTDQLAALFGLPSDFPLVEMFVNSLNELGNWLVAEYGGSYSHLLEDSPDAASLVEKLVSHLSYFNDATTYQGQPVYFYKRAQILVNDLYLAFAGKSYGSFPDIACLTMFADNLLPHYFRMVGVLQYNPALAERIEAGQPLEAGSVEEVELRASAVQCVELACQWLNERQPEQPIFPAQLDNYLWNLSQSTEIKSRPRHRTVTYFY